MPEALVVVFVATYAAIALEHWIGVSKSASALIGAGLLWTITASTTPDTPLVGRLLGESMLSTAQIAFFLLGAMAIVEVIDAHEGFDVVTSRLRAESLASLLWQVGLATFILSAILDNLTTTIVMISLVRRLLARAQDRLVFTGMVVVAANAGGAWSPLGDITTTMLWIGGQVSPISVMRRALLPSMVSVLVPLGMTALTLRGRKVVSPPSAVTRTQGQTHAGERLLFLGMGLAVLGAVPAFHTLTHLPPYLGMLVGLGVIWLVGDLTNRRTADGGRADSAMGQALSRVDLSALLFLVGVLLAVATLEHAQVLLAAARWLDRVVGTHTLIAPIIGIASAVVDNVPLVAAATGMYPLDMYPRDHQLWAFLAYCAGTGGSILVTGSAAGIAAMGPGQLGFGWYLRNVSTSALLGYLAGAATFLAQAWLTG